MILTQEDQLLCRTKEGALVPIKIRLLKGGRLLGRVLWVDTDTRSYRQQGQEGELVVGTYDELTLAV